MAGLRLFPNSGDPGPQFVEDVISGSKVMDHRPQGVTGTSWQDTVTFSIPHFLWQDIAFWWEKYFTNGVVQKRLVTGEIILYPDKYPCQMIRACWDVRDKRTGELFVETATGLIVVTQADVQFWQEAWQLTLYRGDKYLNAQGEFEASTKSCGGV